MKLRNFLLNIFLSFIALFPFKVLYLLSDILFFFTFYVFGYRKKIAISNIKNSFPDKNNKQVANIVKSFYHNLCDLVLEVIKSKRMSLRQLEERVQFSNIEVMDQFYREKKNVIATLGHCGNWEWTGNRMGPLLKHKGAAVYKPVKDNFFDKYLIEQRQKFINTLMIDYRKVFRTLVKIKEKFYTVFILADQSPPLSEIDFFVEFLNQKTAFYQGIEKVAQSLNYAVIYLNIERYKRGYYRVDIKVITENASETGPGQITNEYARLLEQSIRNQPDNWLWSHKRWKK